MTSSSDPVLSLGRELAARLDDWDILGRWMAHYLAELIQRAQDSGNPADRDAAAEMILQIWRQRHTLGDQYPLHNYDAILTTLEHLGDRTSASQLTRQFGRDGPSDVERNVHIPLQIAVRLEETLQDVQTWLLAEAADAAQDQDAPWVELARQQRETEEARAMRRIRVLMRRFQIPTDGDRSDAFAGSETETDADPDGAARNDPLLDALDRSIGLLTTLREARASRLLHDER